LSVLTEKIVPCFADKKTGGKSKEEQMQDKKQELEKRLQDVSGQLGSAKKAPKKGTLFHPLFLCCFC
jgi:hypothetical protein